MTSFFILLKILTCIVFVLTHEFSTLCLYKNMTSTPLTFNVDIFFNIPLIINANIFVRVYATDGDPVRKKQSL